MPQFKIWFKNTAPTVITGVNKDSGDVTEQYILSPVFPDDMEFYEISGGVVVRKNQTAIDAIIAARQAAASDHAAKHTGALSAISGSDLAGKTYAQVDAWVESNVTDLASAKVVIKKIAKVLLAVVKKMDWSA